MNKISIITNSLLIWHNHNLIAQIFNYYNLTLKIWIKMIIVKGLLDGTLTTLF